MLPVAVALGSGTTPWTAWDTGTLPAVAAAIGGAWLGHAVAAGAVLSTSGLFLSLLLTNSRLPYVLARDGLLGAWLGRLHPRFGTPWAAVLLSAAFYAAFAAFSFKELIVLNIWLYSLTLIVELAAFAWLRLAHPTMPPWRVPGGTAGMLAAALSPAACALLAMATAGWGNTLAGLAAALTISMCSLPPSATVAICASGSRISTSPSA